MPGNLVLIYEGSVFSIWAYKKESGEVPVVEMLEEMPLKNQVKFASLFSQLGNRGKIFNETKFKHLTATDKIFEFKVNNARILSFFFSGKRLILTNGFFKKSNKTPKKEIKLAEKIKMEIEERNL